MPSTMATGFLVVAQAVARRWQTPRGGLVDDPNYGTDVSDEVGDDLDPGDLARLAQSLAAEALKDERVLTCTVQVSLLAGVLTAAARIGTGQGPFQLVVGITQVSVTLLQVKAL